MEQLTISQYFKDVGKIPTFNLAKIHGCCDCLRTFAASDALLIPPTRQPPHNPQPNVHVCRTYRYQFLRNDANASYLRNGMIKQPLYSRYQTDSKLLSPTEKPIDPNASVFKICTPCKEAFF